MGGLLAIWRGYNGGGGASTERAERISIAAIYVGHCEKRIKSLCDRWAKCTSDLQSLITPGPNQTKTLEQLPGFQFQSQWGNLAATNQLAAEGLGGSAGPVGTALSNYNQGLASTYWMNDVNALQQYANMGMGAGSALAGNATNAGNAMAQTQMAQGSAEAAGTLGSANALATAGAGSAGNALLLSSILGGAGGGAGLYAGLGGGASAIQNSYAL